MKKTGLLQSGPVFFTDVTSIAPSEAVLVDTQPAVAHIGRIAAVVEELDTAVPSGMLLDVAGSMAADSPADTIDRATDIDSADLVVDSAADTMNSAHLNAMLLPRI